jgi:hypothetical protein
LDRQKLQSYMPSEAGIERQVNVAHAARAQAAQNPVNAELASLTRIGSEKSLGERRS